jgi:di/tricarboxylate transporter
MVVLSTTMQVHPYDMMTATTFATRYVTMGKMIKAGFWLNITAIILISLFVLVLLP